MKYLFITILALASLSCATKTEKESFVQENTGFAVQQIGNEIEVIEASDKFLNPVTLRKDGSVYYCGYADWRSGFFPGSVWYLYELTGDEKYAELGHKYSKAIEEAKNVTNHHDVGFMVYCSFDHSRIDILNRNMDKQGEKYAISNNGSPRFRPINLLIL